MQIPYNQYAQPQDRRSPSPYAPSSPYQQQRGPYDAPQQPSSYGSPGGPPPSYNQYALPSNSPYAHVSQNDYAAPPSPYEQQHQHMQPPHGSPYSAPAQQQYASPPLPSHSPYQYQQEPSRHPQSPPSQGTYGEAASYLTPGQPGAPAGDQDRGLMGALAGGAAGAFAGHKVNHGFLGALGGAFAGHKLQDAISDHNKQKKEEKKQQSHSPQPHQYAQHPPPSHSPRPQYAGNFSASSTQMSIDKDYDLIASCRRVDGSQRLTSISLNDCLTNSDGHLRWARGGGFGASARNVRLVDGGRTLEAELRNCAGRWVWDRIALDEKIGNNDGDLVMV
jgi:hypothetical protein